MTTTSLPLAAAPAARGKQRQRSRLLRVFTGTLLVLTALAAAGGAVSVVMLRLAFMPVLSPSMSPTLNAGDLAITKAVAVTELRPGDVAVLPIPDALGQRYMHRIIELARGPAGTVVATKGDNNTSPDPHKLRITSTSVPVVIGHLPSVGRVALAGQQTWVRIGLILLVGTCALLGANRLLCRPQPSTQPHGHRPHQTQKP